MENIEINDKLILTFSVKKNIKLLKEKNIPFQIKKDSVSKMKTINFQTELFDSNEIVVVKIPYNLTARLFGFKDITIITLAEDKSDYYSDESFNEIEKIIERKYGLPEYCNGTAEHLIFKIGSLDLIHTIDEIRMGWYRHQIIISKEKNKFFIPTKYIDFLNTRNFVLECLPGNMKLSFFWFDKNSFSFIFDNETEGYQCRQNKDQFEIVPYKITKKKDNDGRALISHNPIFENKKVIETSSIEDVKIFIKDYFR